MKVKELIQELQKQDQEAELEFPLQTYTQVYPSIYVSSSYEDGSGNRVKVTQAPNQNSADGYSVVRIKLNLPEGYIISERKKK